MPTGGKKATGKPRGKRSAGGVGTKIYRKAYITRFVLDTLKPEKFHSCQRTQQR